MRISVVIPAKNESAVIGQVVSALNDLNQIDEIIVVDDGSTDETGAIASSQGARVIRNQYSLGNGGAIKTGAREARGDVIVFMDGDGQHNPSDIPEMLKRLEEENVDMVVGSRAAEGQASFGRGMANRFYNMLASYMTGQRVRDLTSGFRVVKAKKFLKFLYLLPNGFSYPTTSTMAFFRAGFKVVYHDISVKKRVGQSHIRPLRDGLRFLLIIFKIGTLYSPLKLFFPISVFIFMLGISYYGYTFVSMGRFTNMSALMFTTALLVFLVGLVSEQITALIYKDNE